MFHSARAHPFFAIVLAILIFLVDTLSTIHFAVASLYVAAILIGARDLECTGIILSGISCVALTALSYLLTHGIIFVGAAPLRSMVSFVTITTTTALVLKNRSANESLAEVERERRNLARFFSPEIVKRLVQIDVPLSAARREKAAVLFADVVEFTALTSGKTPDEVIGFLRELQAILSEAVFAHGGSIDKFLGDGLMAVFGPPLPSNRDATNAALCAIRIRDRIAHWNDRHANNPGKPIRIAVGIHWGEVVQGDIGTDKRLEFTVVGDIVNVASRVEAYCRTLNATVLVTGDFIQSLIAEGSVDVAKSFTSEGRHLLRGCQEPLYLYSLTLH
ncbi:adenylate/guanylate cyclase domain-containing protein [Bradyrhizobium huanghuaihaiense]|uniref:adenylate/guanylate cyclase domain-containing protein n=1 Tax=Bradyrhizobium huanghuaihaiense TaxID=990078 RepID=UPI0013155CE7|nr:adenylate/guanylate cyclase domain-containing protein [Bradyrhizobium huanghuaihaiense]